MDKLKRQLAEADAALEARKKPPVNTGPKVVGEGLVIDEWVSILHNSNTKTHIFRNPNSIPKLKSILALFFCRRSGGKSILLGNRLRRWIRPRALIFFLKNVSAYFTERKYRTKSYPSPPVIPGAPLLKSSGEWAVLCSVKKNNVCDECYFFVD